jgi:hypothetical protein
MKELFQIQETKSPRLLWIEKHGIKTVLMRDDPEMWFPDRPWLCYTGEFDQDVIEEVSRMESDYGVGATEEESVIAWAIANKIKLWNEL